MTDWPSEWAYMTLRDSEIPQTRYALDVMNAWQASTPTPPWSNNPLGVPSAIAGTVNIEGTGYAIFPSFQAFRTWFAKWLTTARGEGIIYVLTLDGAYGQAWRAINTLKWPAAATETDWPSALLDLVEQPYRDSIDATPANQRKTSGPIGSHLTVPGASASIAQNRAARVQAAADMGFAIRDLGRKLI